MVAFDVVSNGTVKLVNNLTESNTKSGSSIITKSPALVMMKMAKDRTRRLNILEECN